MKRLALALLALTASGAASAQQGAPSADAPKDAAPPAQSATPAAMSHHPAPACAEAKVDCAATAVPAFAKDGRLWVAFSVGKSVYAAASSDNGATFSAPTAIATVGDGVIDAHGDARPKIVALKDGTLLATYTTRPDKQMIGTIFTARSTDGGKTFSAPQALLSEGGQRFDSIVVNRKGRIYAGWLDKTHALKAKAEGKEFLGSGVAFAYSDDGGKTFKGKSILIDHACECCRMSGALDKDGTPVFAWRQVLDGNVRDHMVAKLSADAAQATAARVSDDNWAINSSITRAASMRAKASRSPRNSATTRAPPDIRRWSRPRAACFASGRNSTAPRRPSQCKCRATTAGAGARRASWRKHWTPPTIRNSSPITARRIYRG